MDATQLRNFKDFLLLYNRISEHCFRYCADNFSSRNLSEVEGKCVESCVDKYTRSNQKILGVYIEVQQALNEKRVIEMEQLQKKLEESKTAPVEQQIVNTTAADTTTSVTA